ncbi:uncharacterized protein ATNIH1004_009366 [Aspergillus tanneri]|nr:uncharacterized protein ATNIH1004_009366 [Aspergillus tanneri]KAA8645149.1 hypothetical protein ATNIH1004_009366 [Aspergillus tanneri]
MDSKPTYIGAAVTHQNQALITFRSLIDNIRESNSVAIFAYASILIVYSLAFPQAPDSPEPRVAVDDLYQIIVFAHGLHQISTSAAGYLQNSMFKQLFQWDGSEQRLTDDAWLSFEELRDSVSFIGAEDARPSYLKAIDCIQDSLAEVSGGFDAVAAVTRIAIRLPSLYVTLLHEYDPLALVILSYYCVVLHRLRHHWCVGDRGARAARALWFILGEEWKHLMLWAMQDILGPDFLTRVREHV